MFNILISYSQVVMPRGPLDKSTQYSLNLTSMNVRQIRNWWMLLHRCRGYISCSLTRWLHLSVWNDDMAAIIV